MGLCFHNGPSRGVFYYLSFNSFIRLLLFLLKQPVSNEASKKTVDEDDIDFEAMFNLPKQDQPSETASPYDSPKESSSETSSKAKDKNRLSRYEFCSYTLKGHCRGTLRVAIRRRPKQFFG